MNDNRADRRLLWVRVLLTLVALEFFGPILRDFGPSHVFNPSWVGHARVHLVWLLGFFFFSGLANLYLVWLRRPLDPGNLWLSIAWQGSNLGGFWIAVALVGTYDGAITMPDTHVHLFGFDENVVVFTVLSVLLVAAAVLLASLRAGEGAAHAAH